MLLNLCVEKPRPIILEFKTFRIRGHEEASGTKYYPDGLIDTWSKVDPVERLKDHLMAEGVLDEGKKKPCVRSSKPSLNKASKAPRHNPSRRTPQEELDDRFAPGTPQGLQVAPEGGERELRFIDAITEGLRTSMEKHPGLVLMGQDIGPYGGVFKVTDGFVDAFGEERVRNTPLCESAIVGAGLGLSIAGKKAMVEMQFSDFVTCGFNQIVNNLAKIHWRWGQRRTSLCGCRPAAAWVLGPTTAKARRRGSSTSLASKSPTPPPQPTPKGLLRMAIDDPNPVLFFEHKYLYRSLTGPVAEEDYLLEFGVGHRAVREGLDATFVTYGLGVQWAEQVLDAHPDWNVELIDLRTLLPWDEDLVMASVQKTGKALVLHEDTMTGGIGAEISSRIHECCFEHLDAPWPERPAWTRPFPLPKTWNETSWPTPGSSTTSRRCCRAESATAALHDARVLDHGLHLLDVVLQHPLGVEALGLLDHDHGLLCGLAWRSCTRPNSTSPPPCRGLASDPDSGLCSR